MATSVTRFAALSATLGLESNFIRPVPVTIRCIHISPVVERRQAGKYAVTIRHDKPLTYEQANPPELIGHRKSWNSWNTSSLFEEKRSSETAVEDIFIRKFMFGTWHGLLLSEVIIKRRHNIVVIAAIIKQALQPRQMYFLIGYTEALLQNFLKCIVKLELQTTEKKEDVIFKYI